MRTLEEELEDLTRTFELVQTAKKTRREAGADIRDWVDAHLQSDALINSNESQNCQWGLPVRERRKKSSIVRLTFIFKN